MEGNECLSCPRHEMLARARERVVTTGVCYPTDSMSKKIAIGQPWCHFKDGKTFVLSQIGAHKGSEFPQNSQLRLRSRFSEELATSSSANWERRLTRITTSCGKKSPKPRCPLSSVCVNDMSLQPTRVSAIGVGFCRGGFSTDCTSAIATLLSRCNDFSLYVIYVIYYCCPTLITPPHNKHN